MRVRPEALTGQVMQPLVLVDGEYSSSLDGITLGGERLVEIKCPYKGRASSLWQAVEAGELPEHYRWQVQHQLMVAKCEIADVYVFDGSEGLRLEVTPDPGCWGRIREGWDAFAAFLTSKSPPPLAKGDVRRRDDAGWAKAARAYIDARRATDEGQRALDEAKAQLIALTDHTSETGSEVTVTRYWRKGTIDYSKIEELRAMDLERYRGAPRLETRVSVA